MASKEYRSTKYYAVVTFGPDGNWSSPWFLKQKAEMKVRKCDEFLSCHFFSGCLEMAEVFDNPTEAETAARKVRKALTKSEHILADKVVVVELFVK